MTFFWILIPIFAFVLIKHGMDTRARQEKDKLRVLEEALRHGVLDDLTKEELVESLTGRRAHSAPPSAAALPVAPRGQEVGLFLKFLAFVGWISFCVGIAFVIITNNYMSSAEALTATILSCVGFGFVTFPFVIRELQNSPRRHRAPPAQQPSEQRS